MAVAKIAILGECMVEISGELMGAMQQRFGGDTMNTAVYLKQVAKDRLQTSYVTAMGTDVLSDAIVREWQQYGVDCQFVMRDESRHAGLYLIQNDASGERSFQYWRDSAAARFIMQHKDIDAIFEALREFDALYLSGISLAILPETDRQLLLDKLAELRTQGVKLVFDSNYRPRLWQSVTQTRQVYEQIYALCDLALLTIDDEQQLWADPDTAACLARLQKYDIAEIVIKDGSNGCFYTHNNQTHHHPTEPVKQVLDTTAAGDSFNAGYLAGWLLQQDHATCASWGNKLAGQVIQGKGAIVPVDTSFAGQ